MIGLPLGSSNVANCLPVQLCTTIADTDPAYRAVEVHGSKGVETIGREAQHAADAVGCAGVRLVDGRLNTCALQGHRGNWAGDSTTDHYGSLRSSHSASSRFLRYASQPIATNQLKISTNSSRWVSPAKPCPAATMA